MDKKAFMTVFQKLLDHYQPNLTPERLNRYYSRVKDASIADIQTAVNEWIEMYGVMPGSKTFGMYVFSLFYRKFTTEEHRQIETVRIELLHKDWPVEKINTEVDAALKAGVKPGGLMGWFEKGGLNEST